jgi:methanogenic corrinoid protein MtbC1
MFSKKKMFTGAIDWARKYLKSTQIPESDIKGIMESMSEVFSKELPEELKDPVLDYIDAGIRAMGDLITDIPSFVENKELLGEESRKYLGYLLENDKKSAVRLIMDLVKNGIKIKDIYLEIFQPVQNELGKLWQQGDITVAQEHYSTAVTQLIMSQLYSYIFDGKKGEHIFIGACASGELHEIGLRMVSDLLELDGWNTFYLGANVPADSVLETLIDYKAEVVGLSATMTFNVEKIEKIINLIRSSDECKEVKIIVGGYVFNNVSKLWKDIGADGSAGNAAEAIALVKRMI